MTFVLAATVTSFGPKVKLSNRHSVCAIGAIGTFDECPTPKRQNDDRNRERQTGTAQKNTMMVIATALLTGAQSSVQSCLRAAARKLRRGRLGANRETQNQCRRNRDADDSLPHFGRPPGTTVQTRAAP